MPRRASIENLTAELQDIGCYDDFPKDELEALSRAEMEMQRGRTAEDAAMHFVHHQIRKIHETGVDLDEEPSLSVVALMAGLKAAKAAGFDWDAAVAEEARTADAMDTGSGGQAGQARATAGARLGPTTGEGGRGTPKSSSSKHSGTIGRR